MYYSSFELLQFGKKYLIFMLKLLIKLSSFPEGYHLKTCCSAGFPSWNPVINFLIKFVNLFNS